MQLGGVTLTTSIIYLSLSAHRANRVNQALILRQQSLVLNHIVEPEPPEPPQVAREVRAGILETAKDRWNAELETFVRRIYNTDWGFVRERAEDRMRTLWRRTSQEVKELEKNA